MGKGRPVKIAAFAHDIDQFGVADRVLGITNPLVAKAIEEYDTGHVQSHLFAHPPRRLGPREALCHRAAADTAVLLHIRVHVDSTGRDACCVCGEREEE